MPPSFFTDRAEGSVSNKVPKLGTSKQFAWLKIWTQSGIHSAFIRRFEITTSLLIA